MSDNLFYVSRLIHLPLLDDTDAEIGRLVDLVVGNASKDFPPPIHGFVVDVQRRRVFVSANRVAELRPDGARLRRGAINMRPFSLQPGESLVMHGIIGQKAAGKKVVDVAIRANIEGNYSWEMTQVALQEPRLLRRGHNLQIVPWSQVAASFRKESSLAREAAAIALLHPVEMAEKLRALPPERRKALVSQLHDERLADLLEELPEEEQVLLFRSLDPERAALVLNEMEADDAADLLGELSQSQRDSLLGTMDPEEANPVRRLLSYVADSAGGLMTPEPVIMAPTDTVADALARIRESRVAPALAAQVFVVSPPLETPTGRYLGVVGFQRLLREGPAKALIRCLDDLPESISPNAPDHEVASRVAAFNTVAIPVVDSSGRLVGAVTVDDILDQVLPSNWRGRS